MVTVATLPWADHFSVREEVEEQAGRVLGIGRGHGPDVGVRVVAPLPSRDLTLQLVDEQLERAATQALVVRLMRFEPRATLLGLELQQELDRLVGETRESFDPRSRGRHLPGSVRCRNMATYVLVHGAWSGSFCWRKVRPLLQQAGHAVFTPSLTGLGERAHLATPDVNLTTHIQDVYNAIWYEDLTDIILVGHSYGGMVVTGVADRMPERIQHLVYLDAFLPADGQSLYDMGGGGPRDTTDWRVKPLQRNEDPNDPETQWNRLRRLDHPRATLEEKIKLGAPLESRPFSLTYIVATGRPEPGPIFDRIAASLRGNQRWTLRAIAGGHGMIRTNPDGLVRLFRELFPAESRTPVNAT